MSPLTTEQTARAREKREKEREIKRKRIAAKIKSVESKIKSAGQLKASYKECAADISNGMWEWNDAYEKYSKSEITYHVKIVDLFEGTVANGLGEMIPASVLLMRHTNSDMSVVRSAVDRQADRVEEYISELEAEKRELQAELASL